MRKFSKSEAPLGAGSVNSRPEASRINHGSSRQKTKQSKKCSKRRSNQRRRAAAPAKGIQVTDNALKKDRSAMVEENISPEAGRPSFGRAGRRMFGLTYNIRFDTQPREPPCVSVGMCGFLWTRSRSSTAWDDSRLPGDPDAAGFVFVNPNSTNPAAGEVLSVALG